MTCAHGPLEQKSLTMNSESIEITELRKIIEESAGRVMHTPSDFDFLGGAIQEKTKEYLSPTTLKRTWGYLSGVANIRYSTLDILARYAGFKGWDNYLAERKSAAGQNSDIVGGNAVMPSDVPEGGIVEVEWKPDRRCRFRHLGGGKFEVTESVNSHLDRGDTASVSAFIPEEPLILGDLTHKGKTGLTYLCGAKSGLTAVRQVKGNA